MLTIERGDVVVRICDSPSIDELGYCSGCVAVLGRKATSFIAMQAGNPLGVQRDAIVICFNCGAENVFIDNETPMRPARRQDIDRLVEQSGIGWQKFIRTRETVAINVAMRTGMLLSNKFSLLPPK